MRIAISNSRMTFGGGETWSLTAACGLAERGHDVFVFANPAGELFARAQTVDAITTVAYTVRGTGDPLAFVSGIRRLRQHRIELVCANMEREVRILGLSARALGVPFLRRRGSDRAFKNSWGNQVTFRHLVGGLIVNSDATRNSILKANAWIQPERLRRIYNGIPDTFEVPAAVRDQTRTALGYQSGDIVVGILGSLLQRKGHEMLFDAIGMARKTAPEIQLLVVGSAADGSRSAAQAAQIRAAGANLDGVTFKEAVEDPRPIYAALDLLAMPSTNEGFGYVAAEAMAARRPVLVARASSLPEVVGEAGVVLPATDAHAWAEALVSLARDRTRRRQLANKGAQRVREHFSIDRMIGNIEAYFGEILGRDLSH